MNDGLRWLLALGCLCIVFLEAPQDLLQVLQDCSGAYPAVAPSGPRAAAAVSTAADPRVDAASAVSAVAASSPSVAYTALGGADVPRPSPVTSRQRGSEEDRALELGDERLGQRAEFAAGR